MKIVGMIPVRLGSKRIKTKNLRMIDNKPLVQYIIDSSMKSKYLDDIFINSEAKIFEKIAKKNSINFNNVTMIFPPINLLTMILR